MGQGGKEQGRDQASTSKVANKDVGSNHGKENSTVTAQGNGLSWDMLCGQISKMAPCGGTP